jgi:hypothetical protein
MSSQLPTNTEFVSALRAAIQGRIIDPGEAGFDTARRAWNASVDEYPAAIAVCANAGDVAAALRVAARYELPVTVRSGGHNVAGRSVRTGALLIDLAGLREVTVNTDTRIATVQGGAQWADLDAAAAAHGLATTGGLVSTTGVGGLALGGGTGWLMRRYGLACDNLTGADVILADGRMVRATAGENADLFWALKGGAARIGVVTSFDFRLYPLTEVVAGLRIYPAQETSGLLTRFRDYCEHAPDEFCGIVVLANAPPLPFLDAAWHGKPVAILATCWCGDSASAAVAQAPLEDASQPLAKMVGPMPYVEWQKMQDPGAPPGRWNYWKTANFAHLDDSTIEVLAAAVQDLPSPHSEIHVQHMGGAVARVNADESAFACRDVPFFVNLIGVALEAKALPDTRRRVRALHDRLGLHALPSRLPNFTDRDDGFPDTGHGGIVDRVTELRRHYDPKSMFTVD